MKNENLIIPASEVRTGMKKALLTIIPALEEARILEWNECISRKVKDGEGCFLIKGTIINTHDKSMIRDLTASVKRTLLAYLAAGFRVHAVDFLFDAEEVTSNNIDEYMNHMVYNSTEGDFLEDEDEMPEKLGMVLSWDF